jgi:hypothetical protein
MVDDITSALSRIRWLFVIARNSSFTYKGKAIDVKQVGRELGVRYVLEGSVRKSTNRVRITGQLIDASTGGHLWVGRAEGDLEDVFGLQDQITESVVGQVAPELERAEIERAKRKPTENLDAYDYFLRGMANFHQQTNETNSEALRLFYKAIELDPDFALPHGLGGICYSRRKTRGWATNHAQELAEAERLARRAVELDRNDAVALYTAGFTLAHVVGDLEAGANLIDAAVAIDPNSAGGWYYGGWVKIMLGEPEQAIAYQARSMRLSPMDPLRGLMRTATGFAHLLTGRYDEAISWAQRARLDQLNFPVAWRLLASSSALSGRLDQAQKALARALQLDVIRRAISTRIASPEMLLNKSPPVIGVATPNRVGVADGGKNQHASAARGGVGCGQALPVGGSIGEGAHPRRAMRDDGLASQACGAGTSTTRAYPRGGCRSTAGT